MDMITNIQHNPIFDTGVVIKHYEEKDGVPISYVCTSALNHGTLAVDVFYRETPHPDYGNHYFGIFHNGYGGSNPGIMITNADCIEDLEFVMIEVDDKLHYSQHRHDFRSIGNVSIDGGRAYARFVYGNEKPNVKYLKVKDGKFMEAKND